MRVGIVKLCGFTLCNSAVAMAVTGSKNYCRCGVLVKKHLGIYFQLFRVPRGVS